MPTLDPESALPASSDTLLQISGLNFTYQARGLTQTLDVIAASRQMARTINATLVDLSNPAFRKYASKITCTDVDAPPLDNVWPGMIVTVHCAIWLAYVTGNPGSPFKPQVSGSSYSQNGQTFYRPLLEMMVMDVKHSDDEWKHDNTWELDLEEV